MSNLAVWQGDYSVGNLAPKTFTWGDGEISNTDIEGNAKMDADKLVHRIYAPYTQPVGTDVITEDKIIHAARFAGTIVAIEFMPIQVPTDGNKYYFLGVEKSTGGGAWARIATFFVIQTTATNLTVLTADIYTASYVANDLFRVDCNAQGTTGSQGQGLIMNTIFDEDSA